MAKSAATTFDVVIIGGGPAGLSAALFLGRCRRRVALIDDGRPRNYASRAAHGFFTRDGTSPARLLAIGRQQLRRYDVKLIRGTAVSARRARQQFNVKLRGGATIRGRALLFTTGIVDELPHIVGIEAFYGRSVFHCPYCDAWEMRDRPLAVYGYKESIVEYAIGLQTWSDDVVLCTDGKRLDRRTKARLAGHGIACRTEKIKRLIGKAGRLREIEFVDGSRLRRRAIFFDTTTRPRGHLAQRIGCSKDDRGNLETGDMQSTCEEGVFVAGDASRDVNFIAIAVAEGVRAAFGIHKYLRQK